MIKAGTKIFNPDGSGGYEVTADINLMDPLKSSLFKPFGDAEKPEPGCEIPPWFMYAINKYAEKAKK